MSMTIVAVMWFQMVRPRMAALQAEFDALLVKAAAVGLAEEG